MKLLLEAFACHPDRGSEPGVGWNRAVEAARRHDVWVLTSVENRGAIELARSRGVSSDRLHFLFVDAPFGLRMLSRLRFLHCYWAYFWPWFAWRVARRAHARYVFDLAHRVTYASWRFPSHLHRLGIPFIWGPMGGGDRIPNSMADALGTKGRLWEALRAGCFCLARFDPWIRRGLRKANLVLAVNRSTKRFLHEAFGVDARVLPAAGVESLEGRESCPHEGRFDVVGVGVHVPLKAFNLLVRAFAHAREDLPDGSRLVLFGDGPQRRRLESLARELGLHPPAIEFAGFRPRVNVLAAVARARVLAFPSLRDSGGMVLLEAMELGVPVVALDHGGPGEIVTDGAGVKIRPEGSGAVVRALARAMIDVASDPARARRMAEAGRRRVRRYRWPALHRRMERYYSIVGIRAGLEIARTSTTPKADPRHFDILLDRPRVYAANCPRSRLDPYRVSTDHHANSPPAVVPGKTPGTGS